LGSTRIPTTPTVSSNLMTQHKSFSHVPKICQTQSGTNPIFCKRLIKLLCETAEIRTFPRIVLIAITHRDTGNNSDCEVLFEVYSTVGGTFLGCHIVSVDRIVDGKKELLQLKSRRVKVAENISGTLEVVVMF